MFATPNIRWRSRTNEIHGTADREIARQLIAMMRARRDGALKNPALKSRP
jgi:hypothetical protein